MSGIRQCEDHGPFDSEECPVCTSDGRQLLSANQRTQVSTFLSGALRHFPDDVGLALDAAGWADWETVVTRTTIRYDAVDEQVLKGIVHTDPKGRFEVDGDRIRAAYGHSVEVSLDSRDTPVAEVLYHGTSPAVVGTIFSEGLKPMSRQHVHLSGSVETAREVGRRHAADPVILQVDAAAMQQNGHHITKRGKTVYTTDRVPPDYLSRYDDPKR